MKNVLEVFCLLFLFSACGPQYENALVLETVHVLSMEDEEILKNQSVLIADGKIIRIGARGSFRFPADAEIVAGEFYIMPGLSEMHAHIPPERMGEEWVKMVLAMYVSQGITTIRGMLGEPSHLELREKAANHEIVSPRIFTSGPSFNANSVLDTEQAREMVREQKEADYDLLKLHPGLTLEQFDAIADEAALVGIEFSGHISHAVGLVRSLDGGMTTIDHLDRYMEFLSGDPADREDPPIIYFGYDLAFDADEALIEEAVQLTKEAGVWNVPTNTLMENVFNPELTAELMMEWPGMEFIPENMAMMWAGFVSNMRQSDDYDEEKVRRFLELRLKLTKALHDGGAKLLLGSDTPQIFNPPGFSMHRELKLLTDAGLTPFEALKTGTVNVAEYLGTQESEGKVKTGFRADLILLSQNPLENFPFEDTIEGVILHGNYMDKDSLNELLTSLNADE